MKPFTAALLLSLTATGAACSDPVSGPSAGEKSSDPATVLTVEKETVTSETEIGGTLNLNIGGQRDSGSRLLGSGGFSSGSESGVLIGSGGLGGGNFGSEPDIGINIDLDAPALANPSSAAPQEDIVRLPN